MMSGILFVLSAPSGTGKSSLARLVLERTEGLIFSVSHTTRARRRGEESGREYHFIEEQQFRAMMARDEFLEWAEVHGRLYGTSLGPVRGVLESGRDMLLDIDVQGATQVRRKVPEAVTIFVLPPSFRILNERLAARGTDSPDDILNRLAVARAESQEYPSYHYIIVNDRLENAADEVRAVVLAERRRGEKMRSAAEAILATFQSET